MKYDGQYSTFTVGPLTLFPRLLNHDVLLNAVRDGVRRVEAPFAYATGIDAEGYHTGVVYRQGGSVYFDENSILVHPENVNKRPAPKPPVGPGGDTGPSPGPGPGPVPGPTPPPPPPKTSRYYDRVKVDVSASTASWKRLSPKCCSI